MSSAASLLQEPRALFAITPTGSCSAGKTPLLPFPSMLQFLSSVSREWFHSSPFASAGNLQIKDALPVLQVSYNVGKKKSHQFSTFHCINFP